MDKSSHEKITAKQIAELADQANQQLLAYQAAVTDTQNLFHDVVASLAAIKPEEE